MLLQRKSKGSVHMIKETYPVPSWASKLPANFAQIQYWESVGALQAKIHGAQTAKFIQQTGLNVQPSYAAFRAAHFEAAQLFNVPAGLIRGHHRYETGYDVSPLDINDHSTAIGLGQFLLGTSTDVGVPYPYQLHWLTSIWATAKFIYRKGWRLGQTLPSAQQIIDAAAVAGTPAEPKWFKANRAYYSLDPAKIEKSSTYAKQRMLAAVQGFDAITDPKMSGWNGIPHEERMVKFQNGTARSIDWKEA